MIAYVVDLCILCDRPVAFNPKTVPSVIVKGKAKPVCRECMEKVNQKRQSLGLVDLEIPEDAYEPIAADEI